MSIAETRLAPIGVVRVQVKRGILARVAFVALHVGLARAHARSLVARGRGASGVGTVAWAN